MSSSTDRKLDRLISMMEHFISSGEVQVNPSMDTSYLHNYGRYENSHYYNVNGVGMPQNRYQNINLNSFVQQSRFAKFVEIILIPHIIVHIIHGMRIITIPNYAPPQPDFSGFMSYTQAPQHERNQRCHQSLSLNDTMMEVMECLPESWRTRNEIPNIDLSLPPLTDVQTSFAFTLEEDTSDDTLTNLEAKEDTQMEDYLIETSDECEVFPIEPEIVIALNEREDEMNINVNSEKSEMPQIESKEDQPLVLVRPPTFSNIYGTPYKGVEVRERLQIFYTADTFVLDEPDMLDSFVLEVLDELLILKEGVHVSLPKHVDAPFVVDISKGEGIT
ncbi:hypothetical protein Syun_003378 [Stephania yunnanensis]|uniref:Uncharacterized protein n=1 Tax=Stephania yunnanensis TaxID=152371 RepID=A0AAP0Q3U3_9MAGN